MLAVGADVTLVSGSQSPVTIANEDVVNRPAQARHSFGGDREGALALKSGQDVIMIMILCEYPLRQCRTSADVPSRWWYVRDKDTL